MWPWAAHALPTHTADGLSSGKVAWADRFPGGRLPVPPISKSDEEFLRLQGVEFLTTREGIKVTELNELFDKVSRPRLDCCSQGVTCGADQCSSQALCYDSKAVQRQRVRQARARLFPCWQCGGDVKVGMHLCGL